MNTRIGTYITHKTPGESYKAYIPPALPPHPSLDLAPLYPQLEKATIALAELNAQSKSIPNPTLFIYMYVRKEALLSSQIEGTQSSFSDLMLFEHDQKPQIELEDVEEVSHYVLALTHGLKRIKSGFPLSLRLLREIHDLLLKGGRGATKMPGEFRCSQNWIGGTRPGNALFVPPPPEQMLIAMGDFEKFLHDENVKLPMLIKAGLAHVQFETIHPFLDGNGRLGRLLIGLMLCEGGILDEPILYLSLYLKQNRSLYYQLMQEVRTHGTWETWLEFFLDGVYTTATSARTTIHKINELFIADQQKIETLGRAQHSVLKVFEYIKKLPQVTVQAIAKDLKISAPTARSCLNHMVNLNILEEITGNERDKIYVYRNYFDILEEGTEPLTK